jgi:hypothetical protein
MTSDIYLAFEAGSNSVEVSDPDAWRLPPPGWVPGVALPAGNTYTDVSEQIPAEALGSTSATAAARVGSLATILNQAQRWANGEPVEPALLRYGMANGSPRRILSSIIKAWDGAAFLPEDFNQAIAVANRAMTTIAIQRSGALYHTSWRYENLASGTEWRTDPGWSGTTWSSGTLPNGGLGSLLLPTAATSYVSPSGFLSVTNGQTYTLAITMAAAASAQSVTVRLKNAANSAVVSSTHVISMTTIGAIASAGTVYRVTLTASATEASARLEVTTGSGGQLSIGEILIVSGSSIVETWHRTYTEETTTYTNSASAQNPAVMDATFRVSHDALSPMKLTLSRYLGGTDYIQSAAYLLVAPGAITFAGVGSQGKLEIYDWTSSVSGSWANQVEGNGALGGAVRRFTPGSTAAVTQAGQTFASAASSFTGPVQAFASIRNNSATTQFIIYLQYVDRQGVVIAETDRFILPANATNPIWYPIGIGVVGRTPMRGFNIVAQASADSGTMDVDAFAFIKLGPGSSVIKTEAVNTGASNGYNQIVYDHQQLEELAPAVYVAETFSGVEASVGYSGAARLMATGESVCAAWLATSTGKWRHYDTGGVTLTQLSFSATRLPAYITPE